MTTGLTELAASICCECEQYAMTIRVGNNAVCVHCLKPALRDRPATYDNLRRELEGWFRRTGDRVVPQPERRDVVPLLESNSHVFVALSHADGRTTGVYKLTPHITSGDGETSSETVATSSRSRAA